MVIDDRPRLEPCGECGLTYDCLCRCRARIRAIGREIETMAAVVIAARHAVSCIRRDELATAISLRVAIDDYDDAVRAREAIP